MRFHALETARRWQWPDYRRLLIAKITEGLRRAGYAAEFGPEVVVSDGFGVPRKLRICIVTPGALGSNPRVVKEAQALHEGGNDVTVIATRTLALVDRRDEAVLAAAPWRAQRLDFTLRGGAWRLRRAAQEVERLPSRRLDAQISPAVPSARLPAHSLLRRSACPPIFTSRIIRRRCRRRR